MSLVKKNQKYHIILFFFSPILGLIYGLKNGSLNIIRWSIFLYTVIYGSLFYSFFSVNIGDRANDGTRHIAKAISHYQYLDFSIWLEELWAILTLAPINDTNSDVFIHVVSYISIGVFNTPFLFFTLVAIVYGYFFSGAMAKIISYIDWKSGYNKFYVYFFVILFILWMQPHNMQTVRTWTGMWVLIYAVLSYHETKNKKYMILALCPLLIHIGYALLGLGVWLVLFSGFRNPKIYFIIFILSIFVSNAIEQAGFLDFASQTELGANKSKSYYTDDEREEEREEASLESDTNFYKKYTKLGIHHYVLSAMIIFIFINLRKRGFGKLENTLFSYALAEASFANFFAFLYAVKNRSWTIAGFIIIVLMVIVLSKQNLAKEIPFAAIKVKLPLLVIMILFLPLALYFLSSFLLYTGLNTFMLPIITWVFPESGITIREAIGLIL